MSDVVAKARALLAAATDGPWRACNADGDGCICGLVWATDVDAVVAEAWPPGCDVHPSKGQRISDAALIAAAPELLAALADEVERAEIEYQRVRRRALDAEAVAGRALSCAEKAEAALLASTRRTTAAIDDAIKAEAERDRLRVRARTAEFDRDEARAERDRLRAACGTMRIAIDAAIVVSGAAERAIAAVFSAALDAATGEEKP